MCRAGRGGSWGVQARHRAPAEMNMLAQSLRGDGLAVFSGAAAQLPRSRTCVKLAASKVNWATTLDCVMKEVSSSAGRGEAAVGEYRRACSRRSLSLKLSDERLYAPQIRTRFGTTGAGRGEAALEEGLYLKQTPTP